MSSATGRRGDAEPGPEGERAALRAAVARALTPSGSARAEGPRPAAVLPGPRAAEAAGPEASAADSGSAWARREAGEGAGSRRTAGEEAEAGPRPPRPPGRAQPPPAPPPRLGPEVQRAGLATLTLEGGVVQISAAVNEATARVWATAPAKIRPVHLRGLGYPLVGVRCVAEVGGEPVVLDAVVDVGHPSTLEIFKQLTLQFRVRLAAGGTSRELTAPELQRNAATCVESAQAQLGTGEFPPDAYRSAREVLTGRNAGQRLEPARVALSEGLIESCRESAAAAWAGLERLDQASKKDNLSRLLEVDGLPIGTYEKIRSAVLAAAVEFGLPAPARFWRRWLGSEQAKDLGVFVQKLIAGRTASIARGEDLSAEQVEAAWRGLLDLCQHKNLTPPPELSKALGLGKVSTGKRASQPQIKATAEAPAPPEARARSQARRRELAARLRRQPSDSDIRALFAALPELAEDDLVALLPQLADLGARALQELTTALRAPQRQLRQAAAILLGQIGDRKAEAPLVVMLADEPTAAWVDAARALGNLGPRVVGPLCTLLQSAPAGRKDIAGARVARALAELVRVEGAEPGGSGRLTVENLLDVGDPSVASAARRALATLGAVREEVDGEDAEAALRFARLAADAFAPELDAEDDEVDEVEVEVGD